MLILTLISILFAILFELNKNGIAAWILLVLTLGMFSLVRYRYLLDKPWYVRGAGWLGLAAVLTAVMIFVPGPEKLRPAVEGENAGVTEVITVEQGQLTGVRTADGEVEVFAGIPYAAPPVGELRWKEPQDPAAWEGVRAMDHFAPMSMQPQNSALYSSLAQIIGYHDYQVTLDDNFRDIASEDSLYLNIWRPAGGAEDLPVLVYIHGGSLKTGQPWYADYSGEGLAREGVIVVNMGYRLGVYGFYADPELAAESEHGTTGNYGLLDQIKALEWVRDNIAAFGGDPENVTLAGESAGSVCVSALCVSPLARGLFRRAIMESSTVNAKEPGHSYRSLDEAFETGAQTKERLGATSLAQLRDLPASALADETEAHHHITVDGYVLTEPPYESYRKGLINPEVILHGYNKTEGAVFILFDNANMKNFEQKVRAYFGEYADEVLELYPVSSDDEAKAAWIDIYSAVLFNYGHYCLSRQAFAAGIPSYEYFFTKNNGRLGYNHSGELVYFYGNIPADSALYGDSDRELSGMMTKYFANFIRTGDPNDGILPEWNWSSDAGVVFEFGDEIGITGDRFLGIYDILDRMQGWEAK